jgi:hypothetical protein
VRLPVQKNSNNIAVVTEADLDRWFFQNQDLTLMV